MDCLNQIYTIPFSAEWQSGHAADCKSVYAGSIPTSASKFFKKAYLKFVIKVHSNNRYLQGIMIF